MTRLDVLNALRQRRSMRGFLPDAVDRATVEAILADAARSPSASNTQPWRANACAGAVRDRLCAELTRVHAAGGQGHREEYPYYPAQWQEPYLGRRRRVRKDLYGLLGIAKGDTAAMAQQYSRNFESSAPRWACSSRSIAACKARQRGWTWACTCTG